MRLQIVHDTSEAIDAIYHQKVRYTAAFTESKFDLIWSRVQNTLRKKLLAIWTEDASGYADFAIADDRSNSWTQCGGIYTKRVMCRRFALTVAEVLAETKHPKEWGFHCVIELWMTDQSVRPGSNGEFVVKDRTLYIPNDDGFDYSPLLK
jgi:hypothetical protein